VAVAAAVAELDSVVVVVEVAVAWAGW